MDSRGTPRLAGARPTPQDPEGRRPGQRQSRAGCSPPPHPGYRVRRCVRQRPGDAGNRPGGGQAPPPGHSGCGVEAQKPRAAAGRGHAAPSKLAKGRGALSPARPSRRRCPTCVLRPPRSLGRLRAQGRPAFLPPRPLCASYSPVAASRTPHCPPRGAALQRCPLRT